MPGHLPVRAIAEIANIGRVHGAGSLCGTWGDSDGRVGCWSIGVSPKRGFSRMMIGSACEREPLHDVELDVGL